ncbi:MAG: hypothetical protein ACRDZP_03135 [Acidimicrobiales bacterium]
MSDRELAMTRVVPAIAEDIAYEQRCAEDASWTGTRVFVGILAFAFAGLAFSYFYLRSSDSFDLWRPHDMTAPIPFGGAILGLSLLSMLLVYFGLRRLRSGMFVDWDVAGWVAFGAAMLALALQCDEFTSLPFFPGASGYSSTFIGWAAMNCGLLFGGAYWLETLLARSHRLRRSLASEGGVLTSDLAPARLLRASINSCSFYWMFVGAIEILFWILFYAI